jgi:protein glucosyltransferase
MAGARGMSTRMRHLFLCQSLVYHVDLDNYEEFWYTALKKYVHYVPVSADMTDVVDHLTWAKVCVE